MLDIGVRYWSDNPKPNQESLKFNNDIERPDTIAILDKQIRVSDIDENVLGFLDIAYVDSITLSVQNISQKSDIDKIIKVLTTIKKNMTNV